VRFAHGAVFTWSPPTSSGVSAEIVLTRPLLCASLVQPPGVSAKKKMTRKIKHVSKQREATWFDAGRLPRLHSFVLKEGDRLLFAVKICAAPLTEEGDIYFPEGTVVEVQRAETKASIKGAHIAACDGDTYTVQIDVDGAAVPEELKGVAVSRIRPPHVLHKAGTIGASGATGAASSALEGHQAGPPRAPAFRSNDQAQGRMRRRGQGEA